MSTARPSKIVPRAGDEPPAKKQSSDAKGKRHMGKVAALGCIVCRNAGNLDVPAEVHHIKEECGAGQRQSPFLTIPLCTEHHRNGGKGVSYHAGFREFERLYGTELDLLAQTIELLTAA